MMVADVQGNADITPMNRLPIVITGPGEYVRRNGERVTIYSVDVESAGKLDVTCFAAKGSIWRMFRGKLRPRGLVAYHVSGRRDHAAERPGDIIGHYVDVA